MTTDDTEGHDQNNSNDDDPDHSLLTHVVQRHPTNENRVLNFDLDQHGHSIQIVQVTQ